MKNILKILFTVAVLFAFAACTKVDDLPFYTPGTTPTISVSATTVTPLPADSDKVALTVSWTNPKHATDTNSIKYTIEIDSATKNFANAATKIVVGGSGTSFTAKELNTILLGKGYAFNQQADMEIRVISSYGNNNERLTSNTVKVKMTAYKIPPKVALPASGKLFIVGGATVGGWNNPVPVPSQELTRINETTWGGIFQLTANQSYLILPVNGSWDAKFGGTGANNSNNPAGGDFKADGGDLMSPATTGWYKMIFDFQTGKFTVTAFSQQHDVPAELFIVGDATPGQWNNPVPVPSQKFTRLTSTRFELTIALTSGKNYLLLPENGNWGKKFGRSSAASNTKLAGTFAPEGADMPSPDVSGTYKITVDFLDNSYILVKI